MTSKFYKEKYADNYESRSAAFLIKNEFGSLVVEENILRERRKQFNLTQQEVADAAGIALVQYQRLERGERSISSCSLKTALAICDVLELDPHRFTERHYRPAPRK